MRRHRETHGGSYVKIEAEVGVTLPQAKEHLETPEAGRGREGFSPRSFGGSVTLPAP